MTSRRARIDRENQSHDSAGQLHDEPRPSGSASSSPEAAAAGRLLVEQHRDAELGARLVELVSATLANGAQPADVAVLTPLADDDNEDS